MLLLSPVFFCVWFTMSCAMSMVGVATHFLGIFTACKFAFAIWCFFVNLVFFIMKSSTVELV